MGLRNRNIKIPDGDFYVSQAEWGHDVDDF